MDESKSPPPHARGMEARSGVFRSMAESAQHAWAWGIDSGLDTGIRAAARVGVVAARTRHPTSITPPVRAA